MTAQEESQSIYQFETVRDPILCNEVMGFDDFRKLFKSDDLNLYLNMVPHECAIAIIERKSTLDDLCVGRHVLDLGDGRSIYGGKVNYLVTPYGKTENLNNYRGWSDRAKMDMIENINGISKIIIKWKAGIRSSLRLSASELIHILKDENVDRVCAHLAGSWEIITVDRLTMKLYMPYMTPYVSINELFITYKDYSPFVLGG